MSETSTEYGVPKTVCDTESYPPQTGDLLGAYLAKLSARVRELEESRKLGETPIENIDQLTVILGNWCSDLRDLTQVVVRMGDRLTAMEVMIDDFELRRNQHFQYHEQAAYAWQRMEDKCDELEAVIKSRVVSFAAAQAATVTEDDGANLCEWCCERNGTVRPADVILCDQCNAERERQLAADYFPDTPAVTTPDEKPSEFMAGFDGNAIRESMNVPPVCATCGHGAGLHVCHKSANGIVNYWTCNAGPLGKPCLCREYKPVATEG